MKKLSVLGMLGLLALSGPALATLIDRGNGMIYDTDQDITWLQDANYARTSGYDADGRMSWDAATTWAANLVFSGYDDWRLASVTDMGTPGCDWAFSGTDCGYNVDTASSELAYMWYENLGNIAYYDTSGSAPQSGWGLSSSSADGVDILNLQSYAYWSGTEYAPNTVGAWYFYALYGDQYYGTKDYEFYAWAVRSGDVAATSVPEPGALLLLATGLAGVGYSRRRRC